MSVVDQRRIEAEPAQQGQRPEYGEPVAIKIFDQAQDLLPFSLQVRLVDPPVPGVQLDLDDLLLLGRQLGGDASLVRRSISGRIADAADAIEWRPCCARLVAGSTPRSDLDLGRALGR